MPIACCSLVDFYTTHMNTRRSVPYTLWQSLLFMPNRVACPYSYHRHMYCSMYIVVIQAALKDFLVRMQPALDRTATWHSNNTATVLSIYFFIHIFLHFGPYSCVYLVWVDFQISQTRQQDFPESLITTSTKYKLDPKIQHRFIIPHAQNNYFPPLILW